MGKTSEVRRLDEEVKGVILDHEYKSGHRLNLNDLLKRRKEEKNIDKKNNFDSYWSGYNRGSSYSYNSKFIKL